MQKLLTTDQVGEVLQVPTRTLEDWRHRGIGPPWLRVGRHARYPAPGLDAWIEQRVAEAVTR